MMSDEAKSSGAKIEVAQFDSEKNLWRLTIVGVGTVILSEEELLALYRMIDEKVSPIIQKQSDEEDRRHQQRENTNRRWCERDE